MENPLENIDALHSSVQERLQRLYEQMTELFSATDDESDRSVRVFLFNIASELETRPRGLPKEKIDELPEVKMTGVHRQSNTSCTICLEDFKDEEIVKELPCKVSERKSMHFMRNMPRCEMYTPAFFGNRFLGYRNFQTQISIISLSSQHKYHGVCILNWLLKQNSCPNCRYPVEPRSDDQPEGQTNAGELTAFQTVLNFIRRNRALTADVFSRAQTRTNAPTLRPRPFSIQLTRLNGAYRFTRSQLGKNYNSINRFI